MLSVRHLAASVLTLVLTTATPADGAEVEEFFTGIRALGMGGASIAVANDETAIFNNPAGLAKLRDYYVTIADPEAHGGIDNLRIIGTDVGALIGIQDLLDKLNQNKGRPYYLRAMVFPSLVLPNFGFGVLAKYDISAEVNEAGDAFRYDYTNDLAVALGYSLRLFDGIIKIGFNAKFINRTEVHETEIDPTSTGLELEALASEGTGISSDAGLMITAPIRFLPTLAARVRDLGHTKFTFNDGFMYATGDRRPRMQPQKLDAGFALYPIIGKRTRATITGELRDVANTEEDEDIMRRLHAGVEFNIADFLFVRGGMNQRYWTAGLEFATERFQLQLASYGEEIGTDTTPREDRRWAAKFSLRF